MNLQYVEHDNRDKQPTKGLAATAHLGYHPEKIGLT